MNNSGDFSTSILHISDLHFTRNPSMHNMREVVLKEVRKHVHDKPLGQKLLIITGDFHNFSTPDFSDAFKYINDLVNAMGIDPQEDVFLVPGNHDSANDYLMDSFVQEAVPDWKKKKNAAVDKIIKNDYEYLDWRMYSYVPYCQFTRDIGVYPPVADPIADTAPARVHIRRWRNKLNILHLNTTLVYTPDSKGNQMVDINTATDSELWAEWYCESIPTIALGHNSFYDLEKDQRTALQGRFGLCDVSAYLCGDTHRKETDPEKMNITVSVGGYSKIIPNIVCAKGVADLSDDYSDFGYYWHEWDENTNEVTVKYHSWRENDLDEIAHDGIDRNYLMKCITKQAAPEPIPNIGEEDVPVLPEHKTEVSPSGSTTGPINHDDIPGQVEEKPNLEDKPIPAIEQANDDSPSAINGGTDSEKNNKDDNKVKLIQKLSDCLNNRKEKKNTKHGTVSIGPDTDHRERLHDKTDKEKPKRNLGWLLGAIFFALAVSGLVLYIVFGRNHVSIYIDDKRIDDKAYISISYASINNSEAAQLSKLKQCHSLTFHECIFEDNSQEKLFRMEGLESLYFYDCSGLNSFRFLASLSVLTNINIENCSINDQAVANVKLGKSPYSIELNNNNLTTIPFAGSLYNVNVLSLLNNNITDISPLSDCSKIRELDLSGNEVTDISALANCTDLRQLNLNGNKIEDIAALDGLMSLDALYLGSNRVTSVEALHKCIRLETLDLSYNDLDSLNGLENCTILNNVYLTGNNKITDIGCLLKSKDYLTRLDVSGDSQIDFDSILNFKKLSVLNLNSCGVEDLSFVSGLLELDTLNAAGNRVRSIAPLNKLIKLRYINLSDNRIETVQGLSDFPYATENSSDGIYLLLHNNNLSDLNGLKIGSYFKLLTLSGNPITDGHLLNYVSGWNVVIDMSNAFKPEYFSSFNYVLISKTQLDLQVTWENALGYKMKLVSLEDALRENAPSSIKLLSYD